MLPAGSSERTSLAEIAERYHVTPWTARQWAKEANFPPAIATGAGGSELREAEAVNAWVRTHRPGFWAVGQAGDNPLGLPAGAPDDLLTLAQIAELMGQALGVEPPKVTALRSSVSKGDFTPPDRTRADGLEPQVSQAMWRRATAYKEIERPREFRRRRASGERPAPAPASPKRPVPTTGVLDVDGLARRYAVRPATVQAWARTAGFPAPEAEGWWPVEAADSWVGVNRPQYGPKPRAAAPAQTEPASERDDATRLTLADLAARFGLPERTAAGPNWAGARTTRDRRDGAARRAFPAPDADGTWPAEEVDAWAAEHHPRDAQVAQLARRYGVTARTMRGESWMRARAEHDERAGADKPAFPAPGSDGTWSVEEVDAWAADRHPRAARRARAGTSAIVPPPAGDPDDLLTLRDFGRILGLATRGEPLGIETMDSYRSRGQIPAPDRTRGDDLRPRVHEAMWLRSTVDAFATTRPGSGRYGRRT
ncbi:hypothetical protein BIV57_13435 [Mangrovactinospora gilvigrisea]|uniref:DNA-binding protein n=1 Tax=Mangrovactinospora gilvigrisea TaxID=1428644 RepID=A0A1J7BU61_9ACTN|nr:hypothetical protein [Mangrovactinospora gilvigrisea]OIV36985.1 hypothetical protein BIV57_13435 [Mangrovactinospora gilvigrisea]